MAPMKNVINFLFLFDKTFDALNILNHAVKCPPPLPSIENKS